MNISIRTNADPHCPVCAARELEALKELKFRKKGHLPDAITLYSCLSCDFLFTSPASQDDYTDYYRNINNDLIHSAVSSAGEDAIVQVQLLNFRDYFASRSGLNVLDYGCGGGDLIHALASRYPDNSYLGYDVNLEVGNGAGEMSRLSNLAFTGTLGSGRKYDLIILSHVLEHIVDLDFLKELFSYLAPGGQVYIEVPNPLNYRDFERREYLYYIDRLHVNHFSLGPMIRLVERFGMTVCRHGFHELTYKDGRPYPAQFFFCIARDRSPGFTSASVKKYLEQETASKSVLKEVPAASEVLVYGFGDNFFRCRQEGGPLADKTILAVIDQNAAQLAPIYQEFSFLTLDDALQKFPHRPVILTVSWGAAEIAGRIRSVADTPVFTI